MKIYLIFASSYLLFSAYAYGNPTSSSSSSFDNVAYVNETNQWLDEKRDYAITAEEKKNKLEVGYLIFSALLVISLFFLRLPRLEKISRFFIWLPVFFLVLFYFHYWSVIFLLLFAPFSLFFSFKKALPVSERIFSQIIVVIGVLVIVAFIFAIGQLGGLG